MKTILVPLTGFDGDPTALDAAYVAGRSFDAHIQCLHVRADPAQLAMHRSMTQVPPLMAPNSLPPWKRKMMCGPSGLMSPSQSSARTADVRYVIPGGRSLPDAVLETAGALGADLLVMGGYGHCKVRELVFGGFTRQVVTASPLPVLLFH